MKWLCQQSTSAATKEKGLDDEVEKYDETNVVKNKNKKRVLGV